MFQLLCRCLRVSFACSRFVVLASSVHLLTQSLWSTAPHRRPPASSSVPLSRPCVLQGGSAPRARLSPGPAHRARLVGFPVRWAPLDAPRARRRHPTPQPMQLQPSTASTAAFGATVMGLVPSCVRGPRGMLASGLRHGHRMPDVRLGPACCGWTPRSRGQQPTPPVVPWPPGPTYWPPLRYAAPLAW